MIHLVRHLSEGISKDKKLFTLIIIARCGTVDLEIFVVKIFSWLAQATKIKNTKYFIQRI